MFAFEILNVFALEENKFSGNALAVFLDARKMSDAEMQAIALQMNLAETTFICQWQDDGEFHAHVRIFTPTHEMAFAGHPTLGAADVVSRLLGEKSRLLLKTKSGIVPVHKKGSQWELRAPSEKTNIQTVHHAAIARALRLKESDVAAEPAWVHAGTRQLVVQLHDSSVLTKLVTSTFDISAFEKTLREAGTDERGIYLWASVNSKELYARYFYLQNGAIHEDAATGSACANLGTWWARKFPNQEGHFLVSQGQCVNRPSRLLLKVASTGEVYVGGHVLRRGKGELVG